MIRKGVVLKLGPDMHVAVSRRHDRLRRIMRGMGIGLVVLLIITEAAVVIFPLVARPKPAQVIVVLGAEVDANGPKAIYAARLSEAARLYAAGMAPRIVTTGGQGPTEPMSEGEAGRLMLLMSGLPPETVRAETVSTTTLENLLYARTLIRSWNQTTRSERSEASEPMHVPSPAYELHSTTNEERLLIVSSWYHLFRAMLLARCLGIEASYAAATAPAARQEELFGALREVPAIYLNAFRCLVIRFTGEDERSRW